MGEPYVHETILHKLDSFLQYGDRKVYLSREPFFNTAVWENVPLIYADSLYGRAIQHPDFDAVLSGHLPENQRIVGYVSTASTSIEGQPRLTAELIIDDPDVEQIARSQELALSTGFSADIVPDGLTYRVTGNVQPNHILLFRQGSCANCFPRDASAMFLNIVEEETNTMTDNANTFEEKKVGLLETIAERLNNLKGEGTPKADASEKMAALEAEVTQLKNTISERDARIAELEAAEAQRVKDAAWVQMKNTVPPAWLGDRETETRTKFENNKDLFYSELMAHNQKFANVETKPQGTASCGCQSEEEQFKNTISSVEAETGYTFEVI